MECVGPQKNLGNVRGRENGNRVALGTRPRSSGILLVKLYKMANKLHTLSVEEIAELLPQEA